MLEHVFLRYENLTIQICGIKLGKDNAFSQQKHRIPSPRYNLHVWGNVTNGKGVFVKQVLHSWKCGWKENHGVDGLWPPWLAERTYKQNRNSAKLLNKHLKIWKMHFQNIICCFILKHFANSKKIFEGRKSFINVGIQTSPFVEQILKSHNLYCIYLLSLFKPLHSYSLLGVSLKEAKT